MTDVSLKASLPGHQNPVYGLELLPDAKTFYTAGNDRGVVEWNLQELSFSKIAFPVKSPVYSLCYSPNSQLLFSVERSGICTAYQPGSQQVVFQKKYHQLPAFSIKSIDSKRELVSVGEDGSLIIMNHEGELLQQLVVSTQALRCAEISADGSRLAVGGKDGVISIYQTSDYSIETQYKAHEGSITSLRFSPDGRFLFSGGRDAQLQLFSMAKHALVHQFVPHLFAVYDIEFHPEQSLFATASQDKSIKIWDFESLNLKKTISRDKGFEAHTHSVNNIAWNNENGDLLSVGDDRTVKVWSFRD